MPFAELVDVEKEIERLKEGERADLNKELARSRGMLGNENFVKPCAGSKDQ